MSALTDGNRALRDKNFAAALTHYIQALESTPELSKITAANIEIARGKYRQARSTSEHKHVVVCGWELAHNAADRVYTLAGLYKTFADVEM